MTERRRGLPPADPNSAGYRFGKHVLGPLLGIAAAVGVVWLIVAMLRALAESIGLG